MRRTIPNAEFTIESYDPEIDRKLYDSYGIKVVEHVASSTTKAVILLIMVFVWRVLSIFGLNARKLIQSNALTTYRDSDIMLDLGGDNLSVTLSSHSRLFRIKRNILSLVGHTYVFLLCLLLKKPVVIYAQTIGPLGVMEPWIKFLLNKMSLITVREENSLHYLSRIGVARPPIYLTADPAFLLPASSGDEIRNEGIDTNLPIIGICVSSESAKYHYRGGELEFKTLFARIIDELLTRYKVYVVLIPFSTWKGHGGDDRVISREIYDLVKEKERVRALSGKYNPVELKGIVSRCNVFIGSRGHSCILALSSCVPTIAVGHNPKYHGIMKMSGQEQFVCRTHDLTYETVIQLFDSLWSSQSRVKEALERKMKSIRFRAAHNAELVKTLLIEGYVPHARTSKEGSLIQKSSSEANL